MTKNRKLYDLVTAKLIKQMDKGVLPWRRPWGNRAPVLPTNLLSRRQYRGVNALRLMAEGKSGWWATKLQVGSMGGTVQKDAKPVPVISMFMFEDSDGETNFRFTSNLVFNLDDCDKLSAPRSRVHNEISPIQSCQDFLSSVPKNMPKVVHAGSDALYNAPKDLIKLPKLEKFDNAEEYYATLFHEYGHSTGHYSRLDRKLNNPFGSEEYAFEELIAELTSAFICTKVKIEQATHDRAAFYLHHWMESCKKDSRILIRAAAFAQKAADYLQGVQVKAAKKPKHKTKKTARKAA